MKPIAAIALIALLGVTGCGNESNPTVTLYKSSRGSGHAEGIGTFYGFADNQAACEEIAQILNKHADEFSGQIKSYWSCE
jgi:hypothetical protein